MIVKELANLFVENCQYFRLYDLANNDKIVFEDKISKLPIEYKARRVIMIETIYEDIEFDGYLGIYIATKNEDEYWEKYND